MSQKPMRRFTGSCCVVGCQSKKSKDQNIHFYSFPNRDYEVERKKKWITAVRRITKDGKPWVPSKHTLICSQHFAGGEKSNDPRKEAYHPTIFPACYKKRRTYDNARAERAISRKKRQESQSAIFTHYNDVGKSGIGLVDVKNDPLYIEPRTRNIHVETDPYDVPEEEPSTTLFCCLDPVRCHAQTQTNIIIRLKPTNAKVIIKGSFIKPAMKDARCGPDSQYAEGFNCYSDVTNGKNVGESSNGLVDVKNVPLFKEPRTRNIHVETDPYDVPEEEPSTTLFCYLDHVRCHAQTQTNIIVRLKPKKAKVIIEGSFIKPAMKDARCGPDSQYAEGFNGYSDVTNGKSMKALCGVSSDFFKILLQFIQPKVFHRTLSAENCLLLFLMKMRFGLSFVALSVIFKIADRTASRIFFNVLDTLYQETKTWIFWPPRELIKKKLPKSFKNYSNCRAIIDCTEIRTDCPPTVEQRVQMYSSYNSAFTLKYLIAISPSGLITFVSKGYGGRSTNEFITNDSGFLNLLEPEDSILADTSFSDIQGEFVKRNCVLAMPHFADNPQCSEQEVLEDCSVASVRIHIEKVMQRVKLFQVLNHVTVECLPYIDKIMYVACVLANNKEPLIADAST